MKIVCIKDHVLPYGPLINALVRRLNEVCMPAQHHRYFHPIVLSSTEQICPGDDVMFTCETTINTVTWRVTPAVGDFSSCTVFHDVPSLTDTCGPMDVFAAAVSGDDMTSTLSAESLTDVLNGTRVECSTGDIDEEICIVG